MKTFTKMAAQGDFIIMKVAELPKGLTDFEKEGNQYVVAHSETGHNHVMDAQTVKAYRYADTQASDRDVFELFLEVEAPTTIEHLRSYDTHEALKVEPGVYKIKRQREYTPEGFRRAAD